MTSLSPKFLKVSVAAVALAVMGQSCSISLGSGGAQDGGVFRSGDSAQTWQQRVFVSQNQKSTVTLNNVTVRAFLFEPGQPDHIYIGTRENGVWQTKDAGQHWTATSLRSGDYQCLEFDPLNHNIMYTASGSTVLKSQDGGQTWGIAYTESQPGQALTCVVVDPSAGRFVWAFTNGGKVLRSDDYGQTWTLQTLLTPFDPRLIHVDSDGSGRITIFSRGNGIFVGNDHGATWTQVKGNLGDFAGSTDIRDVALTSSGWYIATAYGLLRSTDHGQTWTAIHTLVAPTSIAIQNVAVDPTDAQNIFITVGQKLHHTTDGGVSWSVSTLPTSRQPVFLRFNPDHDDVLYFGTFKPLKK